MKTEVQCACAFFCRMLQQKSLPLQFADVFRNKLEDLLLARFENHWDASNPNKGSAYRCIRINTKMDPIVEAAAKVTGLTNISKYLPQEFTMWVDPDEVSYRFGEDGSICSLEPSNTNESDWYSSPSPSPVKPVSRAVKCRPDVLAASRNLSPLLQSSRKHYSAYSYVSNVYGGFANNHLDYVIPVQV